MPKRTTGAEHEVQFGATLAVVARTVGAAWPAFLAAWAVRGMLDAIQPLLRANHIHLEDLPFGPPEIVLRLFIAAALAVVSGLLIRWLLEPTPASLRLDGRLMGYVGFILLSGIVLMGVGALFSPHVHLASSAAVRSRVQIDLAATTAISLLYALLALLPIGVLMGDWLSVRDAARLMRQSYFVYVGAVILLLLPGAALAPVEVFTHHIPRTLADRIPLLALGSLATTIAQLVLAQIYARRVRGRDILISRSGLEADAPA